MGTCGVGKTSMKYIIFNNKYPKDVCSITYTHDINRSTLTLLGNLKVSLWDCGG